MMHRSAFLFLPLLAISCKDDEPAGDDTAVDDTSDTQNHGTDETWTAAEVRPGRYIMTVNAIEPETNGCQLQYMPGYEANESVATDKQGYSLIFNVARLETNGEILRAMGSGDAQIGPCTLSSAYEGYGALGSDTFFNLNLQLDQADAAGTCTLPITFPCTSLFNVSFEVAPPPGGDDTGRP